MSGYSTICILYESLNHSTRSVTKSPGKPNQFVLFSLQYGIHVYEPVTMSVFLYYDVFTFNFASYEDSTPSLHMLEAYLIIIDWNLEPSMYLYNILFIFNIYPRRALTWP